MLASGFAYPVLRNASLGFDSVFTRVCDFALFVLAEDTLAKAT